MFFGAFILYFIWDLYGDEEPVWPILRRLAEAYKGGTWQPGGGHDGIDVFCADIERLRPNKEVVRGV
jgi:hypothetical protein